MLRENGRVQRAKYIIPQRLFAGEAEASESGALIKAE